MQFFCELWNEQCIDFLAAPAQVSFRADFDKATSIFVVVRMDTFEICSTSTLGCAEVGVIKFW
jgi:hypothetical protein